MTGMTLGGWFRQITTILGELGTAGYIVILLGRVGNKVSYW
jgi:hypothetical protein